MLKIMYILIGIAIIAGGLSLWLTPRGVTPIHQPTPEAPGTMCTMDAMQCPDGSYVGRTGANCEFVCPTATSTPIPVADYSNEIMVTTPTPNAVITSSSTVTGQARGWYFEGSFPVELRDSTGALLVQGPAIAQSDWMTSNFVPFAFTLTFTNPYQVGDSESEKVGTLIFRNDNPSGLPENDKSISIPVRFAP